MTTTKNKLGSVNPCNTMSLFDENDKEIGKCMHAPNSFAIACLKCPKIAYAKTYYQYFGEETYVATDKDIQDRIAMYKKFSDKLTDEIISLSRFIHIYK